jgi:hypothetical protein
MYRVFGWTLVAVLGAAQAQAQDRSIITTTAGVASTSGVTTGAVNVDYGVAVNRHVVIFGGLGRLQNVEPTTPQTQTAVDTAISALNLANVPVTRQERTPAWFTDGGVRFLIPAGPRITPYVFGAVGYGRATPSARFTYQGTSTVTGGATTLGSDATTDVQSAGFFTAPPASSGAVVRVGGGAQVPIGRALAATVGYDFTRLATATAINAGSFTFGLGVRF